MAEQEVVQVGYESTDEYSSLVYQKANAYYGRKLTDAELDCESTIVANITCHSVHDYECKMLSVIKSLASYESQNIASIVTGFKEAEENMARYCKEEFGGGE